MGPQGLFVRQLDIWLVERPWGRGLGRGTPGNWVWLGLR